MPGVRQVLHVAGCFEARVSQVISSLPLCWYTANCAVGVAAAPCSPTASALFICTPGAAAAAVAADAGVILTHYSRLICRRTPGATAAAAAAATPTQPLHTHLACPLLHTAMQGTFCLILQHCTTCYLYTSPTFHSDHVHALYLLPYTATHIHLLLPALSKIALLFLSQPTHLPQ
jgi:hypothetical protein